MNDSEWHALGQAALKMLPTLIIDEARRTEVHKLLSAALAIPGSEGVVRLRDVLSREPEIRAWARSEMADDLRVSPLAGDPQALVSTRFVCPQADFDFYRTLVSEAIPRCPVHGLQLVRETTL